MKARAPGKLVLSGAYAVLRGAPALVTAVDRFAEADTAREATFVTPEVAAALVELEGARAPYFDASALRDDRGKLGLGSSAAIVVASLAALEAERSGNVDNLGERVLALALRAHRTAQGGGSGIDVMAAALGGTRLVQLAPLDGRAAAPSERTLQSQRLPLPPELVMEVWVLGKPASTAELVRTVFALETAAPELFAELLGAQARASEAAAQAVKSGDASAFIGAIAAQHDALIALGEAAGAAIVTPAVQELHERAMPRASFLPSGAGGGDVSLYVGLAPSDPEFREHAERLGLFLLELDMGALGVHTF